MNLLVLFLLLNFAGVHSECPNQDLKLLVAAGISDEGYTTTSEIIDLEQSSETWNDLKPLPTMMDTPMAGYLNSSIPLVCGGEGLQSKFDCYFFEKCQWKNITSLAEKFRFASITTLINSTNVIIGGEKDSKSLRSSIMSFNDTTWIPVGNLTRPVSRHCTVVVKEDTIYIIGGLTESSSFSEETISFNILTKTSTTMRVKLNRGRQLHSCARLNDYHIIVVGGRDARGALKSVETLDTRTSKKWIERKNLELPFGISYAQMVTTNPSGGVVLIGGQSGNKILDTIYKLTSLSGTWTEIDSRLKIPRRHFAAWAISSHLLSDCALVSTTTEITSTMAEMTSTTTKMTSTTYEMTSTSTEMTSTITELTSTPSGKPPGFSKLLICGGEITGNLSNTCEAVDLESSTTSCKNPPNFPAYLRSAIGGLGCKENPIICGGGQNHELSDKCYSLENNEWVSSASMNSVRYAAAVAQLQDGKVLVTGGCNDSGYLSSVEMLTEKGWESNIPSLPVTNSYHCMVTVNSTTVLVIGERENDQEFSGKTFYFTFGEESWTRGPKLKFRRYDHSCGKIRRDKEREEMSIIVAGGWDGSFRTSSVEILDEGSVEWRTGPELPFGIDKSKMVEHQNGSVLLTGGKSSTDVFLDTLYQLPHGGQDAKWTKIEQTLKTARSSHTAILVPDTIVDCS